MAMKICTLTGVDETTPLIELAVIADLYPHVEWGFLYSPKRAGTPGRYPSVERIERALTEVPKYVRMALHICGIGVPQLLEGEPVVSRLVEQIAARGGRVQLNFNAADGEVNLDELRLVIESNPGVSFITQHNPSNQRVTQHLLALPNHAVIFDASGGRGVIPPSWPAPLALTPCGYAGGLGPETLEVQLKLIHKAAGDADYWVDMEGKLRDVHGRFDLRAARNCLELTLESMASQIPSPADRPKRRKVETSDLVELGMIEESNGEHEFELMLRRLVNATSNIFDPSVVSVRRQAEDLLFRRGSSGYERPGAMDPRKTPRGPNRQ